MSSFVLNRRTVLSGGPMLGMSALLVACGAQANNETGLIEATTKVKPS